MDATRDLSLVPEKDVNFKTAHCAEPTIDELLADPLTRALMEADRVDVAAFEQMLQSVAGRLPAGRRIATEAIVALKTRTNVKPEQSIPDYLRWTSLDRFTEPAEARSVHGAIATKASDLVCGSSCSW